jgi:hypothetical protein
VQAIALVRAARDLPFADQANQLIRIEIVGHFLGPGRDGLAARCEFIGNGRANELRRRRGRVLLSNDGSKSHGGSFLVSKCTGRHDFCTVM